MQKPLPTTVFVAITGGLLNASVIVCAFDFLLVGALSLVSSMLLKLGRLPNAAMLHFFVFNRLHPVASLSPCLCVRTACLCGGRLCLFILLSSTIRRCAASVDCYPLYAWKVPAVSFIIYEINEGKRNIYELPI